MIAFHSSGREQAGSEFHPHDQRSGVLKTNDYSCVVTDVEVDPGESS